MQNIKSLFFCLLFTKILFSQNCDEKGIVTDPRNNNAINPEKPTLINKFNWMLNPATDGINFRFTPIGGSTKNILSPWHVTDPEIPYEPLALGTNSNYYPEEGWELLKVNLGRLSDDISLRQRAPLVPYILMYNKYTGILRLFGFLDRVSDYQTIAVELSFDSPNGTNDLNYSSILSLNSGFAQPLTQLTKVKKTTVTTKYPNNQNLFFWTDFPMNYDPCVCKFRSHLRIRFKAIQSGTINLEGSIIGTITPIAATDADGKFKMIIRKATAALTSIAAASAGDFKGALNFSSVVDLLDLIGTGNLSQDDKDAIATLKNMLNLGLNFYNASQSEKNSVKEGLTAVNTFVASQFKSASSSASSLVATAKLQGALETRIDFDGDAISFATPGSYQSELNPDENINNTLDQFGNKLPEYALFNERLGTFSILQSPSIIVQKTTVPPPPEVYDPNTWYLNGITRFRISNQFLSAWYKSYYEP